MICDSNETFENKISKMQLRCTTNESLKYPYRKYVTILYRIGHLTMLISIFRRKKIDVENCE